MTDCLKRPIQYLDVSLDGGNAALQAFLSCLGPCKHWSWKIPEVRVIQARQAGAGVSAPAAAAAAATSNCVSVAQGIKVSVKILRLIQ